MRREKVLQITQDSSTISMALNEEGGDSFNREKENPLFGKGGNLFSYQGEDLHWV